MNPAVIARYMLEFSIPLPMLVMLYLPVRRWLRFGTRAFLGSILFYVALSIVAGSFVCAHFGWPSLVLGSVFIPLLFVLYCVQVRVEVSKSIFCAFNALMLDTFACLYVGIFMSPFEKGNDLPVYLPISSLLSFALLMVLLLVFYRTFSYKFPMLFAQESLDRAWGFAWILPLVFTVLLIWVGVFEGTIVEDGRSRVVQLVLLALVPIVAFYIYDLVWRFASSLIVSSRLRQENELLSMEEKRYEEMREYMESARTLRHDFRHHLVVIEELARAEKQEELLDYVGQLTEVSRGGYRKLCTNYAIDAVAARYEAAAVEEQASIRWLLDLPEEIPFKDTDLCAIIGNLVENALYAVRELPVDERVIEVSARLLSDAMLGITVKNPYKGEVHLSRRGLPIESSKGDGHGIGLSSVESIVRGYNGTINIKTDGGIFDVGILLYI